MPRWGTGCHSCCACTTTTRCELPERSARLGKACWLLSRWGAGPGVGGLHGITGARSPAAASALFRRLVQLLSRCEMLQAGGCCRLLLSLWRDDKKSKPLAGRPGAAVVLPAVLVLVLYLLLCKLRWLRGLTLVSVPAAIVLPVAALRRLDALAVARGVWAVLALQAAPARPGGARAPLRAAPALLWGAPAAVPALEPVPPLPVTVRAVSVAMLVPVGVVLPLAPPIMRSFTAVAAASLIGVAVVAGAAVLILWAAVGRAAEATALAVLTGAAAAIAVVMPMICCCGVWQVICFAARVWLPDWRRATAGMPTAALWLRQRPLSRAVAVMHAVGVAV